MVAASEKSTHTIPPEADPKSDRNTGERIRRLDTYASYHDLKRHEKEGADFVVLFRTGASGLAIIAPHGGGIEPGTVDIADAIAGGDHAFYAFKGVKKKGNATLHLTSNRFDEPIGSRIAEGADLVVAIHGCREKTAFIDIGGRNHGLKEFLRRVLTAAGFDAAISSTPGLRGRDPENICNRCRTGEGIQLEISRGLREKLFDNLDKRSFRNRTRLFYVFVETLRSALVSWTASPGTSIPPSVES